MVSPLPKLALWKSYAGKHKKMHANSPPSIIDRKQPENEYSSFDLNFVLANSVKSQAHVRTRDQLSVANLRNAELHYLYREREIKQAEGIALERKKQKKLAQEMHFLQQRLIRAHAREKRLKSHIRTLKGQLVSQKPRIQTMQTPPQLQKEKTKPIGLTVKHHQHRQPVVQESFLDVNTSQQPEISQQQPKFELLTPLSKLRYRLKSQQAHLGCRSAVVQLNLSTDSQFSPSMTECETRSRRSGKKTISSRVAITQIRSEE